MYTLAAGDILYGVADAASQITIIGMGMTLSNAGVETYDGLFFTQISNVTGALYTTPANTTAFIRSMSVTNTDTVASHTFQLFYQGTAATNALTPTITLQAGGLATYEDGYGWNTSISIPAGTTLLNDIHTGYQDWNAISVPTTPGANTLRMFARKIGGRMLPKWIGPSGLDTFVQPALFANNQILWTPYSSTTVAPNGFGVTWAKGGSSGTVSTLTPASTAPAIINQMRRTRHQNVITTANQAMGIIATAAGSPQFWRGNAAGLGGWFMFVR
jgi:hypothetical protein